MKEKQKLSPNRSTTSKGRKNERKIDKNLLIYAIGGAVFYRLNASFV